MKKLYRFTIILSLFALILPLFAFSACNKADPAKDILSEVRYGVFEGNSEKYALKANSGFREFPVADDKTVGNLKYFVQFTLYPKDGNLDKDYEIAFTLDKKAYSEAFNENEITHCLEATVVTQAAEFLALEVTVKTADANDTFTIKSIVPENTLDWEIALEKTKAVFKDVFEEHALNGVYTGELRLRILVRDGLAYWYAGYFYGDNRVLCVLLDGKTGEVLARREKN